MLRFVLRDAAGFVAQISAASFDHAFVASAAAAGLVQSAAVQSAAVQLDVLVAELEPKQVTLPPVAAPVWHWDAEIRPFAAKR